MVVLAGGGLAMSRYEVTVGEYSGVRVGNGWRGGRLFFGWQFVASPALFRGRTVIL